MKKTTVMAEDQVGLGDQSNLGRQTIRRKALHEKLFEQYGIDEKEIAKSNDKAYMTIPKEWLKEIIHVNIEVTSEKTGIQPVHSQMTDETLSITFGNDGEAGKFEEGFNKVLFQSINKTIESKGQNPKNFNRTIIVEINSNKHHLDIMLT